MEQNEQRNTTPKAHLAADASDPLWQLLDDWKAPLPGDGFDERVMARIREDAASLESNKSGWRSWFGWLGTGRGWAVSATVATLLLAAVLLRMPQDLPPAPEQAATAEFSAQQVELALDDLRMIEELYGSAVQEESQNDRL